MKGYLYSMGITLSLIYLSYQLNLLHIASIKHVDTLFLISLFLLLASACIYVARTNFLGLFMQGWKKIGRVFVRKSFSMQEADELLHAEGVLNEWTKRLKSHVITCTCGIGSGLFVVALLVSFSL